MSFQRVFPAIVTFVLSEVEVSLPGEDLMTFGTLVDRLILVL